MKMCRHTLFLLLTPVFLFGQNASIDVDIIQQKFRSFDYNAVIELADKALQAPSHLSSEQQIKIYEMKAVSHYSKTDLQQARLAFLEILKIESSHTLDPVTTSPKIISFYNSVKKEFEFSTRPKEAEQVVVHDTVLVSTETTGLYKKSIPASIILPGTGHLVMGDKKRGFWITAASVITLSSAIYFTRDTRQKEKEYTSAIEPENIESTYTAYNSAYKKRNVAWAAYAVIWVYAQTDLLFFHEKRQHIQLSVQPSIDGVSPSFVSLNVRF